MPSLGARWLFDGRGQLLPDALLAWQQERIVAVRPRQRHLAQRDLGDAILLPGLVNAHTHLDLSDMAYEDFHGEATAWLNRVIAHRRLATPESRLAAVQLGISESLQHGVTLVGDITASSSTLQAFAHSPLRATLFCEILGLSRERARQSWQSARNILANLLPASRYRLGLSPHAPYSTRKGLFRLAARQNLPLTVHLAEFPEELPLLQSRRGHFRSWLESLGVWDETGLIASYEDLLAALAVAPKVIFIHLNYPTTGLLDKLQDWARNSKVGVVFCPRTHAYFGHAPHPWLDLLRRGIPVAIGTDSRASSPDLSLLAELRFLWHHSPPLPAWRLWRLATHDAALLVGWPETGSLAPGQLADFIAIPMPSATGKDPLQTLLETDTAPSLVCVGGRLVFDANQRESG